MIKNYWILLLIGLSVLKIKKIILFYRHGAREVISKTDNYNKFLISKYGRLTNLGMRQHYIWGKAINLNYSQFIQNIKLKQIKAYTSISIRTHESLSSNNHGLFYNKNNNKEKINYSFKIKNNIDDEIFHYEKLFCSNYLKKGIQYEYMSKYLDEGFFDNFYNLLEKDEFYINVIKNEWNITLKKDPKIINQVNSILIVNYYKDNKYPKNQLLFDMMQDYWFINKSIEFKHKLKTNNLLKFSNIIKDSLSNKNINNKQLLIFSGHDTNLIHILNWLFPNNLECIIKEFNLKYNKNSAFNSLNCINMPIFSSSLIFELHKVRKLYYIKVKYNNKILMFDNKKLVKVEKFINIINQRLIENNNNFNCKQGKKFKFNSKYYTIILLFIIVILCGFLIGFYSKTKIIYKIF